MAFLGMDWFQEVGGDCVLTVLMHYILRNMWILKLK